VKFALDTSVLVAGLVTTHPHNSRAARWVEPKPRRALTVTTHALAECWASLTALPLEPRIGSDQAFALVNRLLPHLRVTSLSRAVYVEALRRCAGLGLRSGAVYDALHLIAAEKVGANVFLTFNLSDFERLARPGGPAIRAPD
jgi:predicted nucleic acid-binding protein